jgi:tetratricopeptide (TPR) repeat protein
MAMGLFDWLKGKGSQQSCLEAIAPAPLETSSSNVVNVIAPAPLNKSSSENDDFEGVYRQGLAELEAGNYERALMFFERAIVINGNQAEVWTKRAVALQNLNRIEEAIEANQRAITLIKGNQLLATNNFLNNSTQSKVESSPSIPEPIINLDDAEKCFEQGNSLFLEGRYQEAIASYDQALKVKPDLHEAWFNRGRALANLGRYEEASTSYDNALKIKSDYHEASYARVGSLLVLARYEEALTICDQTLELQPDFHGFWCLRGLALAYLGMIEEEIASFDNALKIKPDFHEVWHIRGLALSTLERIEEAISSYDNALQIKPDYDEAWNNRGTNLFKLGRLEEAISSFDNALKIKPDLHKAWNNQGIVLRKLGRYKEAISAYDNALKFKPDYHEAWNGRGLALDDLGRYEEAIASYDNALKFKPDYHDTWNNRGLALYKEAIASYDSALKFKPDYHDTWNNRGFALEKLGRLKEAIASYDKALTLTRGIFWQAWINRSTAVAQLEKKRTFLLHSLPLEMQHSDLEEPGYLGRLACLREGLKYVARAAEPEGWGQLHRSTGLAHYDHARGQKNPAYFWRKAVPCYETALEALTEDQFPTAHLETLQDLIRVLTALKDTETAQTLLRKGTDVLKRLLSQKTGAAKDQFKRQFRPAFNELTVALAVQTGDWPTALEIAEQDKNALLRQGLLSNQPAQSPDYGQMQTFVQQQPHTAILYWHLSANALTTFLLTGDQVEAITSDFSQLIALENWIKTWKEEYPTDKKATSTPPLSRGAGGINPQNKAEGINSQNETEGSSWRDRLYLSLKKLKNLLSIPEIETKLAQFPQINRLILIPHRDLHLFPLDSLFANQYTISYLPSIQVGINLLAHPTNPENRLLSIENPDSVQSNDDGTITKFPPLTAAEAESELICRLYSQTTRRHKSQTTLPQVTAQLNQPHNVVHFTGHGYYNFKQPLQSALALSQTDRLTLNEIIKLDLSTYDLACLCACETAIAGNQTITTEYIGIVSAFLYTGVAKVVSTLWTVESVASAVLMVEFHHRRLTGKPENQALSEVKHWLRTASVAELSRWYQQQMDALPDDHSLRPWLCDRLDELATMKSDSIPYENPYFWAAFTLTGL